MLTSEVLLNRYLEAHNNLEIELAGVNRANERLATARAALAAAEKELPRLIPDIAHETRAALPGGVIITIRRPGTGPGGIVTREKVDLFVEARPGARGGSPS